MKPYLEKINPGQSSLVAFERSDPAFPFYWHHHPEYELTLILDSQGQRFVGDCICDYGPGDLVVLGPNLPHTWRSGPVGTRKGGTHRAIVVQFRQDFLGQDFFTLKGLEPLARLLRHSANGLAFGHTETGRMVAESLARVPALPAAKRLVAVLAALVELADDHNALPLSSARLRPTYRVAHQQRIDAMCLYLNEHFAEEDNFTRLARLFHMNPSWMCRFFKRATGRTITAFLNELRVAAAAQLLINTDQTLLDIAFRVGFGNYSNFSRQFKRIKGMSPRALRRQFALTSAAQ